MKRAFAGLGMVTPNNFIQVWDELDKVSQQLEVWRASGPDPAEKMKCIRAFVDFGFKMWSAANREY